MNISPDMFRTDLMKIHRTHYKANPFDAFVDFTKLPADLPKSAKDLLFRPAKMKRLGEVYRELVTTITSNAARNEEEAFAEEQTLGRKVRTQGRYLRKADDEWAMIDKICDHVDSVLMNQEPKKDTATVHTALIQNERLLQGKDIYYEGLLEELLTERRLMSKEERLSKHRNDSVDEIDTTDMEEFFDRATGKRHPMEDK